MTAVLVVCIIVALTSIFILIRNEKVYDYRISQLTRVSEQCRKDIDNGKLGNWSWRYDELNDVSYAKMVFSMRPMSSFYPRDPARPER